MSEIKPCPHCGDFIPDVLFDAHVASCTDNEDSETEGALLVQRPPEDHDPIPEPDATDVDPFDIADIAGAPPEGTQFESDVDDEFMKLVGQLDLNPAVNEVNVALLSDLDLSKRFSEVKQELLARGEMIDPKTQTGRDLHSERAAYLIELRKRGLAD